MPEMRQEMKNEISQLLLDEEVRRKAKSQINGGDEILPVSGDGIDLRLLKTDAGTSNLEFMVRTESERFFKPVGFFSEDESVTVVREFEESLGGKNEVKTLSIRDNAIIGAFDMFTIIESIDIYREIEEKGFEEKYDEEFDITIPAWLRFDREVNVNGLKIELNLDQGATIFSELDSSHGIGDTLGIYEMTDEGLNFGPSEDTKEEFVKLKKMSLLSSLKTIQY